LCNKFDKREKSNLRRHCRSSRRRRLISASSPVRIRTIIILIIRIPRSSPEEEPEQHRSGHSRYSYRANANTGIRTFAQCGRPTLDRVVHGVYYVDDSACGYWWTGRSCKVCGRGIGNGWRCQIVRCCAIAWCYSSERGIPEQVSPDSISWTSSFQVVYRLTLTKDSRRKMR
jgi:hypothetical protein